MKEEVKLIVNLQEVIIGYTYMLYPTTRKYTNKVFKALEIRTLDNKVGSLFFFERAGRDWVLQADYGFLNLDGPIELIQMYQGLDTSELITWTAFKKLVFEYYFSKFEQ